MLRPILFRGDHHMKIRLTATLAGAAVLCMSGVAAASDGNHVAEGDAGTHNAKIDIEVAPSPLAQTVHFETEDGTAVAGRDYAERDGSVTFAPLETEKEISVRILGDTVFEGDEHFKVELSGAADDDDERVTIVDDDPAPAATITGTSARENDGAARFVVSLTGATERPATVSYATTDGTATAGADYVAGTGQVSFAPGETSRTVAVKLLDDATNEPAEAFGVAPSSPPHATPATASAAAPVSDDHPPPAAAPPFGADDPARVPAPTASAPATVPALTASTGARVTPIAAPGVLPLRLAFSALTATRRVLLDAACPAGGAACTGRLGLTARG